MSTIQLINFSPEDLLDSFETRIRTIINEVLKSTAGQQTQDEKYLTRKDVSRILQIDLSTVNNWKKSGRLKEYRIGGRVFFLRSELPQSLKSVRPKSL